MKIIRTAQNKQYVNQPVQQPQQPQQPDMNQQQASNWYQLFKIAKGML